MTGIITRVGADADFLPTWDQITQEKLDITACEYRKDLPTALTVCIAYKTDRMMVTNEPINLRLEDLLDSEAVQRKLGQARHVHLACALRRPAKWRPVLRAEGARHDHLCRLRMESGHLSQPIDLDNPPL